MTKEPTCTKTGIKKYTCTVCKATRTEKIDATGHTPEIDEAVGATCTKTGLTEGSHCSICGEILEDQDIVKMTEHSWDSGTITKEPSCTGIGYKEYECSSCHRTKTEILKPTGHNIVEDEAVSPTCTMSGLTKGSHCSVCGDIQEEQSYIPAIGHDWDDGQVKVEKTCTCDGSITFTCKRDGCGAKKTETIKATGHDEEIIPAVDVSCTVDGTSEGKRCAICHEMIVEPKVVTPALGHDWQDSRIIREATCKETGSKITKCSRCGEEQEEEIPLISHKIVIDPAVEPTTTTTGLTAGTHCSVCGEIIVPQEIIPVKTEEVYV